MEIKFYLRRTGKMGRHVLKVKRHGNLYTYITLFARYNNYVTQKIPKILH